ncbi:MAG: aminoglycoside phosphotransferase family protein [Parachlamydiales bacterium]|nr:aminoglycoside phosphotransferase family protein [Parachlamydiales bacterium]
MNLLAQYKQRLNLHDATFIPIIHEDALVAIVYKIIKSDSEQLALKICDRSEDFFREIYYLKFFENLIPVPKVIDSVEPQKGIHGAVLMEFLPGKLMQKIDVNKDLAHEMGAILAKIHLNRTDGYGNITVSDQSFDPSIHFTAKFEEGLEECSNNLPKALIQQCKEYFKQNIDLLKLADGPCIIHRDFRPGNIIVNDGKIRGIIDWSSSRSGFAQDDFCFLYNKRNKLSSENQPAFFAGYETIRALPDLSIMPFLLLSRAIATIGFTVKRDTWLTTSADLYSLNRAYLEDFFN